MSWLDLLLGSIIVLSALTGARKGFSREIIGLIAAVLALVAAAWCYRTVAYRFEPYVHSPLMASVGGFLAVFLGVLIAGALLSAVVGRILDSIGLSWMDRLLGAGFGAIRGMLMGFGVLMLFSTWFAHEGNQQASAAVLHSRVAPYVMKLSGLVNRFLPADLEEKFLKQYGQIKTIWQDAQDRQTTAASH